MHGIINTKRVGYEAILMSTLYKIISLIQSNNSAAYAPSVHYNKIATSAEYLKDNKKGAVANFYFCHSTFFVYYISSLISFISSERAPSRSHRSSSIRMLFEFGRWVVSIAFL